MDNNELNPHLFKTPHAITIDNSLSYEDKIILLKNWAWDTQKDLLAEYEGKRGSNGPANQLMDEIETALAFLEYKNKIT